MNNAGDQFQNGTSSSSAELCTCDSFILGLLPQLVQWQAGPAEEVGAENIGITSCTLSPSQNNCRFYYYYYHDEKNLIY